MALQVVASPHYLKRRGRPRAPQELARHDTIAFLAGGSAIPWRFRANGRDTTLTPTGRLHSNSADALRLSALAGLGLAQILDVVVRDDIAQRKLEVVLPDHEPAPRAVYAVYTRDKSSLPKVRVFLELLAEALRVSRKPQRKSRRE
jgi:DNA-binding transcriptional LysR family regulator